MKVHQQQLFRRFSQKQQQTECLLVPFCTDARTPTIYTVVGVHIVKRHRTVGFVVGGIGGRIEPQPVTDRVACSYYAGDGRGNALARARTFSTRSQSSVVNCGMNELVVHANAFRR